MYLQTLSLFIYMSLHLYLNHTGGKFVVTLKQGRMRMPYLTDGLHSKGTRAHTQKELIQGGGGVERASEG